MPVFLLDERDGLTADDRRAWVAASARPNGVWSPWLDAGGFVVVAPSEQAARSLASSGDRAPWWADHRVTTCVEIATLASDESPRVVLGNYPTG